jgi:xanthine dehydrogenase accessory factor
MIGERWMHESAVATALARWRSDEKACALATVVATRKSAPRPVGSKLAISVDGELAGSISGGCVESAVALEAQEVLRNGRPILLHYGFTADQAFEVGLPCGGEIDVFVEAWLPRDDDLAEQIRDDSLLFTVLDGPRIGKKLLYCRASGETLGDAPASLSAIASQIQRSGVLVWHGQTVFAERFKPPPRLVIIGATDTTEALASNAAAIGWKTICVDARASFATSERVPSVDTLLVRWPAEALAEVAPDEETAIVIVTHDEKFTAPALLAALASPAFYVGAVGSRQAQATWRAELESFGVVPDALARLHGPAGLDIGAAAPGEVSLSILAELLAVRSGRRGGFLRDRTGSIHAERSSPLGAVLNAKAP